MSKAKFDPSKFSERIGTLYYNGRVASQYRIRQYNKYIKGADSRFRPVHKQYTKYFNSRTRFTTSQGHIVPWAKPLTLSGGKNPNYNWGKVYYRDFDGTIRKDSTKVRWGADINRRKSGSTGATVLVGTKQWIRQVQISLHYLYVNAENFRVASGRRAIKVFQNSFKYQQFYSNKSRRWPALSSYTLKKRARRGTGSRILKEYGDLYNSIKIDEHATSNTTRIYTDIVHANAAHHKKHSICYAGYHNEGKGTYGSGWNGHSPKQYIRRQFMGHSSYLNPFTDNFMKKMVKLYLFDSVFLIKKF